jgi:hypothetical protein
MESWLGEQGNSWEPWAGSAERLLKAARVLKQQTGGDLWGIELMLQGYALENLLKSWYLKKGGQLYDSEGRFLLRRKAKSHNLIALVNAMEYPLETRFHEIVDRLTRFVRWAGRYPFGLTDSETSAYWGNSDQALLDELLACLDAEFQDAGNRIRRRQQAICESPA